MHSLRVNELYHLLVTFCRSSHRNKYVDCFDLINNTNNNNNNS